MVSRGEYEVERVEHELKWITPSGAMKRAFLFEWVGYPLSAATWEERGFGKCARLLAEEIQPLQQRLKTEGEAELAEHHRESLCLLQRELRRVLQRGEGERATDFHVSANVRSGVLTYRRLFGDRLDLLAPPPMRTGPPSRRTYRFSTTAQYYEIVWPRSRLSLLAFRSDAGDRCILAVEARCNAGTELPDGALVYVLTTNRVYRDGKLYNLSVEDYTITQHIEVRFLKESQRNNFRHRGARLQLTRKQWLVVHEALPRW
jgi:hypothetical protein